MISSMILRILLLLDAVVLMQTAENRQTLYVFLIAAGLQFATLRLRKRVDNFRHYGALTVALAGLGILGMCLMSWQDRGIWLLLISVGWHLGLMNSDLVEPGGFAGRLKYSVTFASGMCVAWYAMRIIGDTGFGSLGFTAMGFACILLVLLLLHPELLEHVRKKVTCLLPVLVFFCVALFLANALTGPLLVLSPYLRHIMGAPSGTGGQNGQGLGRDQKRSVGLEVPPRSPIKEQICAYLELENQPDEIGLRFPLYLRQTSYRHFSGRRWLVDKGQTEWRVDGDDGVTDGWVQTPSNANGIGVNHIVYLPGRLGRQVLSLPGPVAFGIPELGLAADQTYLIASPSGKSIAYNVYSKMTQFDDITADDEVLSGPAAAEFLALPEAETITRIRELAQSLVTADMSAKDKVEVISYYLDEHCEYDLKRQPGPRVDDPLKDFLFGRKHGHCTLFATACAVMLRAVGVPARVGIGFCSNEYDSDEKICVFRRRDYHAWTEVNFADHGWVVVDATPVGGQDVIVAQTSQFMEFYPDFQFLDEGLQGNTRGHAFAKFRTFGFDLRGLHLQVFLVIAGLVVAASVTCLVMSKRNENAGRPMDVYRVPDKRPYYRLFSTLFSKTCGIRRMRGQTAREYLHELQNRGLVKNELDELVSYHYAVQYQGAKPSTRKEREFIKVLQGLRRSATKTPV